MRSDEKRRRVYFSAHIESIDGNMKMLKNNANEKMSKFSIEFRKTSFTYRHFNDTASRDKDDLPKFMLDIYATFLKKILESKNVIHEGEKYPKDVVNQKYRAI